MLKLDEDAAVPTMSKDQVIIKVVGVALMKPVDAMRRAGKFQFPIESPIFSANSICTNTSQHVTLEANY